MPEKFVVVTGALIYNDANQILIAKRNPADTDSPGIYAFPGGKVEYDESAIDKSTNNIDNPLETNLKKEVREEVNLEIDNLQYLQSHSFTKSNGDRALVAIYLAKYAAGTAKPDGEDMIECKWISEDEIDDLNSIKIVKNIYHAGFTALKNRKYHDHIEVAGIVLNDKNEFLVLKEAATNKYIFPHGTVENLPGRTWEVLEKNLMRNIYSQSGVEIADGMIPFTDREFLGKDGFEKILQFFICKYSNGEAMVTDPFKFTEVKWMGIDDMNENDFRPLVFAVYKKAFEFINRVNN